ncbi:sensor histidine kinase [Nonomuraea maritima]|uniref:sensor histidine kinase n=1 Tax=Nonomuraea maritima TaxID=683260 RepID=UPI0037189736
MKAWHRMSITTRITVFSATAATVLCALLAATVMMAIHRFATGNLVAELAAAGGKMAYKVETDGWSTPLVEHAGRSVQVVDQKGAVATSTPALLGKPAMASFTPQGQKITMGEVCGGVFPPGQCQLVVAQPADRAGQNWAIFTSLPSVPWYVEPWLAATVIGAAALLALAVTGLGRGIATASLMPVTAIRAELDKITETCPEQRVSQPRSQDEIRALADSVNQTLARLQAAMEQQRTFTTDASHELRTPIAAIRAEVEDALYAPEDTSIQEVGNAVLPSLDRLETIVGDLLTIARQQIEDVQGEREPIDLSELVTTECGRLAEIGKSFEYVLEPGVMVTGSRPRLARLLSNLLDNAERHAGHTIALHVRRSPCAKRDLQRFPHGVAMLEVIDDGPGIDPDKRELVFQRFARLDTARGRHAGGTGLGLPMARQIAEAHGGSLRIEDSTQGTRLVLRLPLA